MIPGLGRSLKRLPRGINGVGSGLTALGVAGAGIYGFSSGIGSKHVSDNIFEMTTGDPQFDRYALGTDVGVSSMLFNTFHMPGFLPGGDVPIIPFAPGYGGRVKAITQTGGIGGGLVGAGAGAFAGLKMSGVGGSIAGGIAGGIVGAAAGAGAGFRASSGGLINSTTISDTMRARRYDNRMPVVDGGLVFGAYNSRMGGY
jgi:hypothetical protein